MNKTPEILSNCIRDLYMNGFTTASGGNISQKDEDDNIWISPSQIDKGFLKPNQFACLKNNEWIGEYKPSMEFPFHLAIYENDPEVKAVCHLHPPALVALSCIHPDDKHLKSIMDELDLGYAEYAIPGSEKLGENIIRAFQSGTECVLMQNHGIIAYGSEIFEAAKKIEKLEKQLQILLGIYSITNLDHKFTVEKAETLEYYQKRIVFFLSIKEEKLKIEQINSGEYYAVFKHNLYCDLANSNDKYYASLIPECFLLLRNPVFIEEAFNHDKIPEYLNALNTNSPIQLFKDGNIVVIGESLFNLYDRIEVLVFSLKVLLYGKKIGKLKLLTYEQILELRRELL